MTAPFKRVANYGESSFVGPCEGPLWRHSCGNIAEADLLGESDEARRPWAHPCPHCRLGVWSPLFAYAGPLCDQCDGNGWVSIGGQHPGFLAFQTVTECTACDASGVSSRG